MSIISAEEARTMKEQSKSVTADFVESTIEKINDGIECFARVGNRYVEIVYPPSPFPVSYEATVPYAVHIEIYGELVQAGYKVDELRDDEGAIVGVKISWDKK